MALLAANPAVRELLVRPLEIRLRSLRRYLGTSAGSDSQPAAALPAAEVAAVAVMGAPMEAPPLQVVVTPSGAELDLCGVEAEAEADEAVTTMQRLASMMQDVVESTLRV